MKKIGRNDLCPCGSNKKYKFCHLDKEDEPIYEDSRRNFATLQQDTNNSKIEECFYKSVDECSGKIIKAHSIQNNRILSKLKVKGHVLMPKPVFDEYSNRLKVKMQKIGTNQATIFTGFCKKHDDQVFKLIDTMEFDPSSLEQKFLYVYRTFAKEYHTKKEALLLQRKSFDRRPNYLMGLNFHETAIFPNELSMNDNDIDRNILNEAIARKKFDLIDHLVVELDFEIKFAVSSLCEIERDLNGKTLNDIFDYNPETIMRKMIFNIFPENNKTIILLSWFKRDADFYSDFIQQLKGLSIDEFLAYLNDFICSCFENVVINENLWKSWSNDAKKEFLALYDFTTMLNMNPLLSRRKISPTNKLQYNLFAKLQI